jgi:hypothetical protein
MQRGGWSVETGVKSSGEKVTCSERGKRYKGREVSRVWKTGGMW